MSLSSLLCRSATGLKPEIDELARAAPPPTAAARLLAGQKPG